MIGLVSLVDSCLNDAVTDRQMGMDYNKIMQKIVGGNQFSILYCQDNTKTPPPSISLLDVLLLPLPLFLSPTNDDARLSFSKFNHSCIFLYCFFPAGLVSSKSFLCSLILIHFSQIDYDMTSTTILLISLSRKFKRQFVTWQLLFMCHAQVWMSSILDSLDTNIFSAFSWPLSFKWLILCAFPDKEWSMLCSI